MYERIAKSSATARLRPILFAIACLLLAACSDDPIRPDVGARSSLPALPYGHWFVDSAPMKFLGIAANEDQAVAISGADTYAYDGVTWQRVAPGVALIDMTMATDGTVFALRATDVWRLDGDVWTSVFTLPGTPCSRYGYLGAIWAHTRDDVFVAGPVEECNSYYFCTMYHFDGSQWTEKLIFTGRGMHAMWGSSSSDVFAAGPDGTMFQYDGLSWTKMNTGISSSIEGIWGRSASDVFAVGSFGVIHFDGNAWRPMDLGVTGSWSGLRGSPNGDLYFWGDQQDPLRFDGTTSEVFRGGDATTITGILVKSRTDIFTATAGGLLHYDGHRWRRVYGGGSGWRGIWASPTGEVFVAGEKGAVDVHAGSGWQPSTRGDQNDAWCSIWGTAYNNVYIVGANGKISHFDGQQWSALESGTAQDLLDITGWANSLVAVGTNVAIAFDGVSWKPMSGDVTGRSLRGVWGSGPNDVFAVGERGALLHYDGSTWSALESGVQANLNDIWGYSAKNIYVVGDMEVFRGPTRYSAATILHFDGLAWSRMESRYIEALRAVWGNAPNDVFALGWNDIARYDGRTWGSRRLGRGPFEDLQGNPSGHMFAVNRSNIMRFEPVE